MHVFLDFEASSLAKKGYPIEIGWVFEDGAAESHLIRPAPQWTDWDRSAEALHGISRARLEAEGTPHEVVARRMVEVLDGHSLYASAPSWDGKWLSVLLRAAGIGRHALRLRDIDEAQEAIARATLTQAFEGGELERTLSAVLRQARQAAEEKVVRHRALADAEQERALWLDVRRRAEEAVAARLRTS